MNDRADRLAVFVEAHLFVPLVPDARGRDRAVGQHGDPADSRLHPGVLPAEAVAQPARFGPNMRQPAPAALAALLLDLLERAKPHRVALGKIGLGLPPPRVRKVPLRPGAESKNPTPPTSVPAAISVSSCHSPESPHSNARAWSLPRCSLPNFRAGRPASAAGSKLGREQRHGWLPVRLHQSMPCHQVALDGLNLVVGKAPLIDEKLGDFTREPRGVTAQPMPVLLPHDCTKP